MTKTFQTTQDRTRFVYLLGEYYAALGGTFGAYREAAPAFENARNSKLYARAELGDADFAEFEAGFKEFQKLRTAMQLQKAQAEAEMKDILNRGDLLAIGDSVREYYDVAEMIEAQENRG